MNPEHDLIRALIHHLRHTRDAPTRIPDDEAAAFAFLAAVHDMRCPRCRSDRFSVASHRTITCRACRDEVSITASTALARTRVPLRHWLLAAWHIGVCTEGISARGFGRRYRLRAQTAWALLHRVRDALVHPMPRTPCVVAPITGFANAANRVDVAITLDDDALAIGPAEAAPRGGRAPTIAAVHVGQLRAWLFALFRGVHRRHVMRYVAEWIDRYRRATRSDRERRSF